VNKIKVVSYYNRKEKGVCVVKRKNESDESLVRRFRKKFAKSGIMKEYKEKMYFEKPSDKKRRKRAQAAIIRKQEEAKREKYAKKMKKQRNKNRKGDR
jgi:small subunit ribosomal protein S21